MCGNESTVLSRPGLPRLNRNMRHITRHFYPKYPRDKTRVFLAPIAQSQISDRSSDFPFSRRAKRRTEGRETERIGRAEYRTKLPIQRICQFAKFYSHSRAGLFVMLVYSVRLGCASSVFGYRVVPDQRYTLSHTMLLLEKKIIKSIRISRRRIVLLLVSITHLSVVPVVLVDRSHRKKNVKKKK